MPLFEDMETGATWGVSWRDEIIGIDGDQPIIRAPYVTGQDLGVDLADAVDRKLEAQLA